MDSDLVQAHPKIRIVGVDLRGDRNVPSESPRDVGHPVGGQQSHDWRRSDLYVGIHLGHESRGVDCDPVGETIDAVGEEPSGDRYDSAVG